MCEIIEYKNKYFSILGDSISTFEGVSLPMDGAFYDVNNKLLSSVFSPLDTWWGKIVDALGGKVLVNNSISGSTVIKHPLCEIPSYGCSDERTSGLSAGGKTPDVIMVYLGTNDWGMGIKVDDENEVQSLNDCEKKLKIFSVAYRVMINKLQKFYPNAQIWCLTLPKTYCSCEKGFEFSRAPGGRDIAEYCKAIQTVASDCGCKIINLFTSEPLCDTLDGFHPTAEGMTAIANAVLKSLKFSKKPCV